MGLSTPLKTSTSALYSGCGNRFIITTEDSLVPKTRELCLQTGTDGLVLIKPSTLADFKIHIYNADGSEAEMCGNGLRCAVKFAIDQGCEQTRFSVERGDTLYPVLVEGDLLAVAFPFPKLMEKFYIGQLEGYSLNTGVPHAVFFVDDLNDPAWMEMAPSIRRHPRFPQGTNVNFAALTSPIRMRTFERGVERETGSCGTGTVAVALAAQYVHGVKLPVTIVPTSQDPLIVSIVDNTLYLKGPAEFIRHV